jgi:outer membrane protein assembly factor BamB
VGPEEPGPALTRRVALKGLGGLGVGALAVTGCAARNPAGHALATAAMRRAARPPGTLLWHARAPGGIISLVAADGLLCAGVDQADGLSGVFGAYAMHAGTGRKAWAQYADAAITPDVAEAGVLFGNSPAGVGALSAADGKALWTADAGVINPGLASTWVLVAGGTVCTTGDIGPVQEPRNVVLGLDSGTGRRRWTADFPSGLTGITSAAGLVFAGSPVPPFKTSGKVAALDPATGRRRWTSADLRITPGEIVAAQTAVAISTSLQSSNPGSYCTLGLDIAAGHELWRADGAADPLAAAGERVYGVGTRTLWARDARTGRVVWERAFTPAVLTVTEDIVLAGSSRQVQALSAAEGNELWSCAIPAYPIVITIADDVVYVASTSNPLADAADEICAFQA